jgi:hypothetical protein
MRTSVRPTGMYAQARGDFQVLAERDRCTLRAHLGSDGATGLATLHAAITAALAASW